MVKGKLVSIILLALLCPALQAQDFYVYIRTYDRIGVTADDNKGRSKKGDIVDVVPVENNVPSDKAKTEYLIVKVSGLTQELIDKYRTAWNSSDVEGAVPIAYRKFKLNVDNFPRKDPGIYAVKLTAAQVENYIRQKTEADLTRYEQKRLLWLVFNRTPRILAKALDPAKTAYAVTETVSTINKTGETYPSLKVWEDTVDGDLTEATGNNTQQTAEVYDDEGLLIDDVTIDGSTCDASHYLKVTVPAGERHNGTAASGAHIESRTYLANAFTVNDTNVVIEWLIISATDATAREPIRNNSAGFLVQYCILTHSYDDGLDLQKGARAYCNIIYGVPDEGITTYQDGSTYVICNNTVYGCGGSGIDTTYTSGSATLKNNLSIGNTGGDYTGTWDVVATNGSGDTSGQTTGLVAANTFVNVASDYHLKAGAGAIDQGTDLSAVFTVDIDGSIWTGTWEQGADMYVSADSTILDNQVIQTW